VQRWRGGVVAAPAREVPRVMWELITASDERERCCIVIDGERCGAPTAFGVSGPG
jgi:hypothetical protein